MADRFVKEPEDIKAKFDALIAPPVGLVHTPFYTVWWNDVRGNRRATNALRQMERGRKRWLDRLHSLRRALAG